VNDHVNGCAIAFPATSDAVTDAVYVAPAASAADGVNVTVLVVWLYTADPATDVPAGFRSVKTMLDELRASLNVALTAVPVDTPVAPAAGEVAVTDGGVVSAGPDDGVNVTSTQ
jgi:hypothetical protein